MVVIFKDCGCRERGAALIPLGVNFDELLNSSELQYSLLSHGNNNTHLVTSPWRERSPSSLNHTEVTFIRALI